MQIEEAKQELNRFKEEDIHLMLFENTNVSELCYLREAIDTVLNELEEQTEANKELNKELNKVLIHFKAVINEMAKYINNKNNGDIYDLVCARECKNEKCRMSEGDNKYQELECIKQYFYKKAQK